ncbi:hypothetical protein BJ165DRAFT_1483834 [Panaeolus papilionaceus]|nr:hypothetical protein BJ165DRAFT_1483834 [Panaeolus papilionaceus]
MVAPPGCTFVRGVPRSLFHLFSVVFISSIILFYTAVCTIWTTTWSLTQLTREIGDDKSATMDKSIDFSAITASKLVDKTRDPATGVAINYDEQSLNWRISRLIGAMWHDAPMTSITAYDLAMQDILEMDYNNRSLAMRVGNFIKDYKKVAKEHREMTRIKNSNKL